MSKTPSKRLDLEPRSFSPKEVVSPSKHASDISKTFYSHLSNLHELLTDWRRTKEKGTKICKAITALQQRGDSRENYSTQLEQLTRSLVEAYESLGHIVDGVQRIDKQLKALAQLNSGNDAVISTWPSSKISENVTNIMELLQREYLLKKMVTENIAHTQDENLLELYASLWEFDIYISDECSAYLFAEFGMPGVT